MVNILPYDPKVEVLWATPSPAEVVTRACSVTQRGVFAGEAEPNAALIKFLLRADHGSPLEHAVISFDISQISRACADQVRTHRIASHTMSSTHYQDHSGYRHRVDLQDFRQNYMHISAGISAGITGAMYGYVSARDAGVPLEAARQCLPLSTEVRQILTINARSLVNFITLRLCYRNTMETILLAERVHKAAIRWFPELFTYAGKACDFGGCKEGKMACDKAAREERLNWYAKP